ncbi:MAG: hypothetical protein E6J17_01600 [Chloroflexi bacterium]|nr:MAG: hypothetical protein E6J17_01600 [Chloroflexota bacterium]
MPATRRSTRSTTSSSRERRTRGPRSHRWASPSSSARSRGCPTRSARFRSRPWRRRLSAASTRAGNTQTGDTLGIHLIGPHVTDLVAEASLAFELDATPWEIGGTTHAHPTLSEVLGEAAMAVDGRSINF